MEENGAVSGIPVPPSSHSDVAFWRSVATALAGCVGLFSALVTYLIWNDTLDAQHERAQAAFEMRAQELGAAFERRIEGYAQSLRAVRAMVQIDAAGMTQQNWQAYVAETRPDTFAVGVDAANLLRPVKEGDRDGFTHERRIQGNDEGFTVHPIGAPADPDAGESVVVTYVEPETRRNSVTMGADLFSDPVRRAALIAAREHNAMAASAPLRLIDDPSGAIHFSLYMPVVGRTATGAKASEVWGYVNFIVNARSMTVSTLRSVDRELLADIEQGMRLSITDTSDAAHPLTLVEESGASVVGAAELAKDIPVNVGGRTWTLGVRAPAALYGDSPARARSIGGLAGLIGLLFTGLVYALARLWFHSRDVVRMNEILRQRDEELRQLALSDSLTGLGNRRQFRELGTLEWARLMRNGRPFAAMMIDIDHFKVVNDTHGHAQGDATLVMLAGVLRSALRDGDLLARLGGEEFAILMPETTVTAAGNAAERLRLAVAAMNVPAPLGPISVTVSIGVAAGHYDDADFAEVIQRADHALYTAKNSGRNRVVLADSPSPDDGPRPDPRDRRAPVAGTTP